MKSAKCAKSNSGLIWVRMRDMDGYGIYSKLAFLGKKKSESIYCKDMCAQSCGKSSGFGGFGVAGFRLGKSLWVCCFWWLPLSQPTNCSRSLSQVNAGRADSSNKWIGGKEAEKKLRWWDGDEMFRWDDQKMIKRRFRRFVLEIIYIFYIFYISRNNLDS